MHVDSTGHDVELWQGILAGIGVALIVTAAALAIFGTGGVAAFGIGALIGAAAVGVIGAGIGAAVGYLTGGVDGILGGALAGFGIGATVGFIVGGAIGLGVWKHDVKLARQFLSDNGVPLNKHDEIISTFKYRVKIKNINANTNVYRYWGGKADEIGRFVSTKTYSNPVFSLA